MLGHFCDPLPEETLYSALARWCALLRFPSQKFAVSELLGTETAQAVVDLPCHLNALIAALPPQHGHTADKFIDLHTLLRFYIPFSSAKRINRLRRSMRGDGKALHMSIGLMAGRVRPPSWLRSCPECDRQDLERYGEPYWHRLHQLAGIEICPKHRVFLEESTARRLNPRTRHVFVAARLTRRVAAARPIDQFDPSHRKLLALALDAAWLLTQSTEPPGQKAVRARYVALLVERGLASASGRVRWKRLLDAFEAHFPPNFLHQIQCGMSTASDHNWLARLVRAPRAVQSPLRHLLLIQFLGHTAETFFRDVRQSDAFGTGPWPCLNRVCTRHRRFIIKACSIEYHSDRSRPVGVFECPVCAQTYCRLGPDRKPADRFTMEWVRDYGTLWVAKLIEWWQDPLVSLRETARRLGVDPMTIKRRAAEVGLPFPRVSKRVTHGCSKPLRAKTCNQDACNVFQLRRTRWMEAIAETPALGIKLLRERLPALYMQLYRHDREWLRANQPVRQLPPSRVEHRVNWAERDLRLARLVPAAVARIRGFTEGGLRQITRSAIGKELGQLGLLEKHLKKLPETRYVLAHIVETRIEFALRRIGWAAAKFSNDSLCPSRWQLIRRAGVRPDLVREPAVNAALGRALTTLVAGGQSTETDSILPCLKSAA